MILPNKQPDMGSLADMPNPSKSAPDPPKHTRAAGFGGAVGQGHASAKVEDLARFSAKTDDPEASPPRFLRRSSGSITAARGMLLRVASMMGTPLSRTSCSDTESQGPWPE